MKLQLKLLWKYELFVTLCESIISTLWTTFCRESNLPSQGTACWYHVTKRPVDYAHLDGDWYGSSYRILEHISPYLSIEGYFVLNDVY